MDAGLRQTVNLVLVSAADTEWDERGRLAGGVDLPLSDRGRIQAVALADQLAGEGLSRVVVGAGQAARQTAEAIAGRLKVSLVQADGLDEIGVGLWEGLTVEQIRQRSPRLYRQWLDEPTSMCPPQGESVVEAADRLMGAIRRIVAGARGRRVAVVLGRMALATARCRLEGAGLDTAWSKVDKEPRWGSLQGALPD